MKFTVSDIRRQNQGTKQMWERQVGSLAMLKIEQTTIVSALLNLFEDEHVLTTDELSVFNAVMNCNSIEESLKVADELLR